jgi:hypothetical protein
LSDAAIEVTQFSHEKKKHPDDNKEKLGEVLTQINSDQRNLMFS